jgi:hypothetical protein
MNKISIQMRKASTKEPPSRISHKRKIPRRLKYQNFISVTHPK